MNALMRVSTFSLLIATCHLSCMKTQETPNNNFNTLYNLAHATLKDFNPSHNETTKNLITIIQTTKQIPSKKDLFTYLDTQSPQSPINPFCSKITTPLLIVFFDRIYNFLALLEKNSYTLPTLEEYQQHVKHEKFKKENNDLSIILEKASHMNILLCKETIEENLQQSPSLSTPDFNILIEDIHTKILNETNIKNIAKAIKLNTGLKL